MSNDSFSRRTVIGTAGSIAVLALAGCAGSANSGGSQTTTQTTASGQQEAEGFASVEEVQQVPGEPVEQATVEMTMVSKTQPVFDPEITWVKPGGSVTWKNVDEDPHTTTAFAPSNDKPQRIPDGADGWDSGILKTDQTFTQTFDNAGVYQYYCTPHESLGMVGIVVVGTPDPAGQPAFSSFQDSIPQKASSKLETLDGKVKTLLSSHQSSSGEEFASKQEVESFPSEPVERAKTTMTMVSETEPVFNPEITWVKPGGSVTWKNVDEDPHTTTAFAPSNDKPQRIPDGADGWDSGILETDQTFTQTFDTEGIYDYYCTPHEALGMVGVVIVGTPDLSNQPAMTAPQDSIPETARSKLTALHKEIDAKLS